MELEDFDLNIKEVAYEEIDSYWDLSIPGLVTITVTTPAPHPVTEAPAPWSHHCVTAPDSVRTCLA